MTTEQCDFRRFTPRELWFFGRPVKGQRKKKVRCPRCGKRLHLKTIVDRQDGDTFLCVPDHRTTVKRLGRQLRLPGVK